MNRMSYIFGFLFIRYALARFFQLKHPEEPLYVNGKYFSLSFEKETKATLFNEVQSSKNRQKIMIETVSTRRIWDFAFGGRALSLSFKRDTKGQNFEVIHLSRDVVVIKSGLGGCVTYDLKNDEFRRKKCRESDGYINQVFLVTDKDGIWAGSGTESDNWNVCVYDAVNWGICEGCLSNGFGSSLQGGSVDGEKDDFFRPFGLIGLPGPGLDFKKVLDRTFTRMFNLSSRPSNMITTSWMKKGGDYFESDVDNSNENDSFALQTYNRICY